MCPSDFNRFCNYTPLCPNFCSENGFCVRGACICFPGWGNTNCSVKCDNGVIENNVCVQ